MTGTVHHLQPRQPRPRPELDGCPDCADCATHQARAERLALELADVEAACTEALGPPDAEQYGAPAAERVRAAIDQAAAAVSADALLVALHQANIPADRRDAEHVRVELVKAMGEGER